MKIFQAIKKVMEFLHFSEGVDRRLLPKIRFLKSKFGQISELTLDQKLFLPVWNRCFLFRQRFSSYIFLHAVFQVINLNMQKTEKYRSQESKVTPVWLKHEHARSKCNFLAYFRYRLTCHFHVHILIKNIARALTA